MKVAIIGGSGKMGRWFAEFLHKDGQDVVITGRNVEKLQQAGQELGVEVASIADAVKSSDVILLSVSIDSFEKVVAQISPLIQSNQTVIDITSTKAFPVGIMHKYIKAGSILGAHPMFGPGAAGITNQNFALTPTNEREQSLAQKVREYLEARKARVTLMTPQEHDEIMTIILGLSHYIAIVSADALLSSDRFKQMEAVGGITYKLLLTLVESVYSEDPGLYASVQMNLPDLTSTEKLFQRKAKEWTDLVENKDRDKFIQRMESLKNKLEKDNSDFGKSYKKMYKIVDGL